MADPQYAKLKTSGKRIIELTRTMPAIELPRAATDALTESDEIVAMIMAQEAARRIAAAPEDDWERGSTRIAAETAWHGGEPGPRFHGSGHDARADAHQRRGADRETLIPLTGPALHITTRTREPSR